MRGVRDGVSEADGEVSVSCVAVSLGASPELSPEPERAREDARAADALKDHGFEVPWRACLSPAMRGSRDAKRVAKWASIVAENNPEEDANATTAALSGEEKDAERRAGGARGGGVLLRALDRRLALYPTSLEHDEDALRMYREQLERAVLRTRELEEAEEGDAGTTSEGAREKVAEARRSLVVARRAALATALRAREKRALAATRASLAGDAGGDIFAWADAASPTRFRDENSEENSDAKDEL